MNPFLLALTLSLSATASARMPEDFAFDLYRAVASANTDKNVFLSPAGARWTLGMVYAGSAGGTREQMAKVLGAKPLAENLKFESERLSSLLQADEHVRLHVANSLWLKKGSPIKKSFVTSVEEAYKADVFERGFTPADVSEVNSWVAAKTEGKIKAILKEFKDDSRAVLLNAVYFKGNWTAKFSPQATKEEDFRLASGKTVKRKLMDHSGDYAYFEGPNLQAVRLPYGNKRLAMIILLPGRDMPLSRLNALMTASVWRETLAGMRLREGRVRLPKFKLEFTSPLNGALKAMRMTLPFDRSRADFTAMSDPRNPEERLFLSEVLQKAYVEVNEEGTEAAAATHGVMGAIGSALPQGPPFDFHADHPFLYAISDDQTGEILFLGALHDPK